MGTVSLSVCKILYLLFTGIFCSHEQQPNLYPCTWLCAKGGRSTVYQTLAITWIQVKGNVAISSTDLTTRLHLAHRATWWKLSTVIPNAYSKRGMVGFSNLK